MQRFGVLPADSDALDHVDAYATDHVYWQMMNHQGETK
jgi:hypothetical protein